MPNFSRAGEALLQQLEGLRLAAYDDATGCVPIPGERILGRMTIGYGHTGPDVVPGLVWTTARAEQALTEDVDVYINQLIEIITAPLSDNQFSALVCLAFNIGTAAFAGSSALRLANEGDLNDVPVHLKLWNKVEENGVLEVSPGLVGRRAAESALWALPDDAAIPGFAAIRDQAVSAMKESDSANAA